jgi:hypothetical protein
VEDSTLTCIGNERFMILGNHSSRNRKTPKHDFSTGKKSRPRRSRRGGQVVYCIEVQKKVIPKNLGIRIRDPMKSEVPTR